MNRFSALLKTTAVRLSALYILLFCLVAAGLSFYMVSLSVSMVTEQTQESLREELANIQHTYQDGGLALLVQVIDRRARQPGAFLYLITDPFGRVLTGNVASIAPGVLKGGNILADSFYYTRFGDTEQSGKHRAVAALVNLPNGMKLLVGRDLGEPVKFIGIIRKAMLIAFAVMGGGALLIWLFIGRRALESINRVNEASKRIMAGDLSGRLPVSGAGDEFDRLAMNLNIMLDRIEELNVGLKQVSDNIAHDLKTPLTRLRNRAEEMLMSEKNYEAYRQGLEGIITESDQLIRIFNAILTISYIEAGPTGTEFAEHNLKELLEDAAEIYEPVAEEMGVELILEACFDYSLPVNRELVAQSMFNLIDNAIKYGCDQGTAPRVTLSMEQDENYVRLVVCDKGVGIAQDQCEKVTERFVRLETSRTKPGFGIGLSLAKAVMKLHHGTLILEDAQPGLRAVLAFPCIKAGV
ncbi:ATP-binding protein [Bartonella sp. DGB2]|uniref:sensor histidine kinase n=1 Tax=Bartonella sp. DGB2 TaxID=3388426 RepID=UPI00398F9FB9